MVDRSCLGYRGEPFSAAVEKGRLKLFAKATGQTDPIYFDEIAARAAGYPSLPVPPTFLFCLEMECPDPYRWFADLDIPLARALHGEQEFQYFHMAYAGDTLRFESEVIDYFEKKGGALLFVVQRVRVHNQLGQHVADFNRTLVVRNES
ncbi:MAG: MaoC family dehydratase N-terminal domain-containing protein [Pseudomonadota bacterium]